MPGWALLGSDTASEMLGSSPRDAREDWVVGGLSRNGCTERAGWFVVVVGGSGVAQELEKLARLAGDPGSSHRPPVRFQGLAPEG